MKSSASEPGLRDFNGKQFHCEMSCDLEVTNESAHCREKKAKTKH